VNLGLFQVRDQILKNYVHSVINPEQIGEWTGP